MASSPFSRGIVSLSLAAALAVSIVPVGSVGAQHGDAPRTPRPPAFTVNPSPTTSPPESLFVESPRAPRSSGPAESFTVVTPVLQGPVFEGPRPLRGNTPTVAPTPPIALPEGPFFEGPRGPRGTTAAVSPTPSMSLPEGPFFEGPQSPGPGPTATPRPTLTPPDRPIPDVPGIRVTLPPASAAGEQPVAIDCASSTVTPAIYQTRAATADGSPLLDRAPVYYVLGSSDLDLTLTIPQCTAVTSVESGGQQLLGGEGSDDVSGSGTNLVQLVSDELIPQTSSTGARRRQTIRVPVSGWGQGESKSYRVSVQRTGRLPGTPATLRFTTVSVKAVGGDAFLSVSEADLRNQYILNTLAAFHPSGYSDPGSGLTFSDPDYDPTYSVDRDGIHFSWAATARAGDLWGLACDPRVRGSGVFKLTWSANTAGIDWQSDPDVQLDWPRFCDIGASALAAGISADVVAALVPVIATRVIEHLAVESVRQSVQSQVNAGQINQMINQQDCRPSRCQDFIAAFEHVSHELRVLLSVPVDRVQVDVLYAPLDPAQPVSGRGLALPQSVRPVVAPHGLLRLCDSDIHGYSPGCETVEAGPTGLPNGNCSGSGAIPCSLVSSILPIGTVYPAYASAFSALTKVRRDAGQLPLQGAAVGGLLARMGRENARPSPLAVGSQLPDSGESDYLELSMNDHAGQPYAPGGFLQGWTSGQGRYGSGILTVSILFAPMISP